MPSASANPNPLHARVSWLRAAWARVRQWFATPLSALATVLVLGVLLVAVPP